MLREEEFFQSLEKQKPGLENFQPWFTCKTIRNG